MKRFRTRSFSLLLALAAGCMDYRVGKDDDPKPYDDTGTPDSGEPADTDTDTDADTDTDTDTDTDPEIGCADGTREGFLSLDDHPAIAACSGAWSVGGVTRPDLAPTCGRSAGDDGSNVDGTGCSAADLCAAGWHVCNGKTEVAAKAPAGCGAAVPDGTPDKSLFFAVRQQSDENSECDDGAPNGNDVFGCGNLGTALGSEKGCGVLTRVLASMNPDSCGFNEAEPPLGPWECQGGTDSHYHEGELVTKDGCPGDSCSYDGQPVGSSDKGGVLCCRD